MNPNTLVNRETRTLLDTAHLLRHVNLVAWQVSKTCASA